MELYRKVFNKQELKTFHLHFFHPSSTTVFNLIYHAHQDQGKSYWQKNLDNISPAFETCQCQLPKPPSFQVRVPNEIKFNFVVALDFMQLESSSVLHIVDIQTNSSAASFFQIELVGKVLLTSLNSDLQFTLGIQISIGHINSRNWPYP